MRLSPFTLAVLALPLVSTLAQGSALAQEVLVEEDFESGSFPSGWPIFGTIPIQWRISDAGDCGMPSRMAAFNHASACNYFATFSTAGLLSTHGFDIPAGRALRVEFDYALEIDLVPDTFEVRLESSDGAVSPQLITDGFGVSNDGMLHSASFLVSDPSAFVGAEARVSFWISGDTLGNLGLGLMFDNVRVSLEHAGVPLCFGDGTGAACPCLNFGGAGEGCANSTGVGAILESAGSSIVAVDDLQLTVTQARPNTTGIFIQGTTQIALPFKDGILCTGNPTERLEVVQLDGTGAAGTTNSIVTGGAVAPGDSRVYQLWYRDPALSPCGTGSNLSSALLVQWS
ncbi:MAG: hypothetical protein H6831_06610 [Planctomycetes bacterium]|nr:hypothetical protein [Planctomycetota bacterium]MCB9904061.1 hypothetical protein [Planctomycetota bacterium]